MMGKRMLSAVLALVLCVSLLPVTAKAAVVASGTCGAQGNNLTWSLDDAGTLTVSGNGAMANYDWNTYAPWYSRRNEIQSILVQSGITSIGNEAFTNCYKLTDVTLPDGLLDIGDDA